MRNALQSEAACLWDTGFFRLNKEEANASAPFREWLRSCPSDLGRYLADVNEKSPAGRFDRDDVSVLEKLIVRNCAKRAEAVVPLTIFAKVAFHLNRRFQKCIPQPRYVFTMKRESNPFVPEIERAHRAVQMCLAVEEKWIESISPYLHVEISDRNDNVPPELIVLSAALHGGIIDIDVAVALFDALLDPEKSFHFSESSFRVYADLSVASQGVAHQEVRRWYPDDKLICLIARTANTSSAVTEANRRIKGSELSVSSRRKVVERAIWNAIAAEFERQELDRADDSEPSIDLEFMPKSLGDLFQKVLIVLHSEIPAVLAEYAARHVDCRSLLLSSIGRIYGDPAIDLGKAPQAEDIENDMDADLANAEGYGGEDPPGTEPLWLPDLREVFRGESDQLISERLCRLLSDRDSDPPQKRICSFAKRLAERGSSSGNRLHPSSVRCCALTAARRVGRVIGAEDPAKYATSTLETLYLSIINDAALDSREPRRLQKTVAWVLREFHRFLVCECGAQPINEAEVFRFPRGMFPVDARIISVEDVAKALDYLDIKASNTKNLRKQKNCRIAQAEIVFGFFAGLRRMEGLGLRRIDYFGGNKAQVIVRATETRNLKTANATRRIPIGVMTHPFSKFLNYPNRICLDSTAPSSQGKEAALFEVASDDVIIPIIHDALQAVTGDRTLHYHTLRHSFCCWTLLRLMLSDLPEIPDLFPHLEMTREFLHASKDFRKALYGNETVTNDHLWALSTLMGHSAPPVSLSNYTHIFDLLLPLFIQQSERLGPCSDLEFRIATGLGKERASKLFRKPLSEQVQADASTSASMHGEASKPDESMANGTLIPGNDGRVLEQEKSTHEIPIRTQIAIGRFRKQFKDGAPVVADQSTASVLLWLDATWNLLSMYGQAARSHYFSVLNTGFEPEEAAQILNRAAVLSELRTQTGAYVHRMAAQPTLGKSAKKGRGCCPVWPRLVSSQALVAKLSSQLQELVESDPKRMKSFLEYYARNVLPDSCRVVFQSPFDQRAIRVYIDLLSVLGIGASELQLKSRDGTSDEHPGAEFLTSCGLPLDSLFSNTTDGPCDRNLPCGGLTIEPAAPMPGGTKVRGKDFTDALRFVLLMGAIAFG